ncbi:dTDP-4-dehydrorhamnose 3,5-epimerase [Candidatus Curtissbacteria bacterium]|nr:dTDP-4-dehydrorhamnose 3,5-epimerase [Candidatus Curtissbacteria bacterium]
MNTRLIRTPISDLFEVEIDYFQDERGFFMESWNQQEFAKAGLDLTFVQDSLSGSKSGVLRGLHFQDKRAPLSKLVRCSQGKVFDVAVDMRKSSRTFGRWFGVELSGDNKKQLYIPAGFAHGYQVLSDWAEVFYKQTEYWNAEAEVTLIWNDPDVGIIWPIADPILSDRDARGISFATYLKNPAFT